MSASVTLWTAMKIIYDFHECSQRAGRCRNASGLVSYRGSRARWDDAKDQAHGKRSHDIVWRHTVAASGL